MNTGDLSAAGMYAIVVHGWIYNIHFKFVCSKHAIVLLIAAVYQPHPTMDGLLLYASMIHLHVCQNPDL